MSLENFNLERISTLKKGEKVGAKKNSQVKASHLTLPVRVFNSKLEITEKSGRNFFRRFRCRSVV